MAIYLGVDTPHTAHGWTCDDDRDLDPDADERDEIEEDEAEYDAARADDWYQAKLDEQE